MPRAIQDILDLRRDISPFLIHLTRDDNYLAPTDDGGYANARGCLELMLRERRLRAGFAQSDIKYGGPMCLDNEVERQFLRAVSFSETPLDETHCMLEIQGRAVNLKPYGIVFFKKALAARGVSPVIYLNNMAGDKDQVAHDLFELTNTNPGLAQEILPLIAFFGQKITPGGAGGAQTGINDWRWEREWRYPSNRGPLTFDIEADVFAGLCPDDEIDELEAAFPGLPFVDPRRPMRWYSTKLMERRRLKGMTESVV